jgi:hypothetical protein
MAAAANNALVAHQPVDGGGRQQEAAEAEQDPGQQPHG